MSKTIPGPYEYSGGAIWATSPWNARVRLCTITYHAALNGIDNDAQARLFAAAPMLAAAVREMFQAFTPTLKSEHRLTQAQGGAVINAKKALALLDKAAT